MAERPGAARSDAVRRRVRFQISEHGYLGRAVGEAGGSYEDGVVFTACDGWSGKKWESMLSSLFHISPKASGPIPIRETGDAI